MTSPLDEDFEDVPIPLDHVTLARLVRFARSIGRHPRDAAGVLLHDLLADSEFWGAADNPRLN